MPGRHCDVVALVGLTTALIAVADDTTLVLS